MTEQKIPRRGPGRPPNPDGQTPHRQIRLGDVWERARKAAKQNDERFAVFVERALDREIQRSARARARDN